MNCPYNNRPTMNCPHKMNYPHGTNYPYNHPIAAYDAGA